MPFLGCNDASLASSKAALKPLSLSSEALAEKLSTIPRAKLLILDFRSFLNYNQSHIQDAISVNVPAVQLKRKGFSMDAVEKNICKVDFQRFSQRQATHIILYDDTDETTFNNVVLLKLFEILKQDSQVSDISWLEGGFKVFSEKYPNLCKLTGPSVIKLFRCTAGHFISDAPKSLNMNQSSGPDEPVQILNFLYLAGEKVAGNKAVLQKFEIKHILNVAVECENSFPYDFNYLRLELFDSPSQTDLFAKFDQSFQFINKARDLNQRVLVHCRAGQSRSVTIIIAYLMFTLKWNLTRAYSYVQRRRPSISPNLGFMGQLTEYEALLEARGHFTVLNALQRSASRSSSSSGVGVSPGSSRENLGSGSSASSLPNDRVFAITFEDVPNRVRRARANSTTSNSISLPDDLTTSPVSIANSNSNSDNCSPRDSFRLKVPPTSLTSDNSKLGRVTEAFQETGIIEKPPVATTPSKPWPADVHNPFFENRVQVDSSNMNPFFDSRTSLEPSKNTFLLKLSPPVQREHRPGDLSSTLVN